MPTTTDRGRDRALQIVPVCVKEVQLVTQNLQRYRHNIT